MRRYDKWLNGKKYRAKLNLLAKIHKLVDPIVEAQIRAFDYLDGASVKEHAYYVDKSSSLLDKVRGLGVMEPSLAAYNNIGYRLTTQEVNEVKELPA